MAGLLEIPLRIAAELFYRTSCIKDYISQVKATQSQQERRLSQDIETAVVHVENVNLKVLGNLFRKAAATKTGHENRQRDVLLQINASLGRFSHWFTTIHELLAYLPRNSIHLETVYTLQKTFGNFYNQHRPTLILGTIFNAFEFDFLEILKYKLPGLNQVGIQRGRSEVLQLALCDRGSPVTWSILAHEMGHAMDRAHRISQTVAGKFVTDPKSRAYKILWNWAGEFCADLIAAHTFGPSPIISLLSFEYCIYPRSGSRIFDSTDTHPPTKWRLQVVADYSRGICGGNDSALTQEEQLYKRAWDQQVDDRVNSENLRKQIRDWDRETYEGLIIKLVKEILSRIKSLELLQYKYDSQSVGRCKQRLKDGRPIAAQGCDREVLTKKLIRFKSASYESDPERKRAYEDLLKEFNESPLSPTTIIHGALALRSEYMKKFTSPTSSVPITVRVRDLITELRKVDEDLVSSIRTSQVANDLQSLHGSQAESVA